VNRAATGIAPRSGGSAAPPPAVRLIGIRKNFGNVVAADGIDLEIASDRLVRARRRCCG
jgi:hypothetical protein